MSPSGGNDIGLEFNPESFIANVAKANKAYKDFQAGIDRLVDPIEKPEEFLMAMAGLALADNGPFEDVQCGE